MSRWEPNTRGRLEQAALELYRECGFDQTTVTEIAERAGLTERTFFRYFAFKTAFARWASESDEHDLARLIREALDQLKVMIASE